MSDIESSNGADMASESTACSSPICGNCGKPLHEHYFEDEVYCYLDTNGDIYTDDPREDFVTALIPPSVWEGYVDQWKRENGHSKTNAGGMGREGSRSDSD